MSSSERARACGAAAVLNAAVPMALLVTKRKRNYSNEAYAGLGIIRGG